jgi:membrane-associated phospholipid phosphatase
MNFGIKDVFRQVRLFFILYLIVLCGCLIIKILYSKEQIYFAVNAHYSDWADFMAPYFTDLGLGWTTIIIAACLALFSYRKGFLLATAYAVTSITAQIIKHIVGADRPKLYFHAQLSRIHFVKGLYIDMHDSFPSGHTVTAFSTALVLTYFSKNKKWGVLYFIIAIMIAYSRMYLSEHFFEDVIAGSIFGVFLTIFWIAWLDGKKFLNSPKWNRGLLFKS